MMDELVADIARKLQRTYYGKYRAFVIDNKDPHQLGRVRLKIPSVLGDEITSWALPCVPYGGTAGLGWFVVPDVDAQVWAEFEEGDLRHPIWVGTFWQKQGDPPADAQLDEPTTRLWQTTAGHILQFDDADDKPRIRLHHAGGAELLIDEHGAISITDQAGNALTLDANNEKLSLADTHDNALEMSASGVRIVDGNQNAIELGSAGVKISSAGQIVLDASAVMLGGSGGEPVLKGSSFLTLFATHVHTSSAPASPTSPPVPQGANTALSTAVTTK